jgi:signal transduction histidine kinase
MPSAISETYLWNLLIATGLIGLLSVAAGWVMAGRVIRPLHDITRTARGVAERNLGERIQARGPDDELKELADTFDAMLERLDRAFDGQRRFAANASHELRTPLTVSRTHSSTSPSATRQHPPTCIDSAQHYWKSTHNNVNRSSGWASSAPATAPGPVSASPSCVR